MTGAGAHHDDYSTTEQFIQFRSGGQENVLRLMILLTAKIANFTAKMLLF